MFRHKGVDFTAFKSLLAALFRGELQILAQSIRIGQACRQYAQDHDQAIDDATLQAASESYRQSAGLTSAQATADWLESKQLTLDDFIDYLDRLLCRQRFENSLEKDIDLDDKDLVDLLWPELVFSGALERYATTLAQRIAVAAENDDPSPAATTPIPHEISRWLGLLGAPPETLTECAALERTFTHAQRQYLTPDHLQREFDHRRVEFLRVRVESLSFANEHVANEAYLCISEEGESLENFCAVTSSPAYCYTALLSELPEELQRQYRSAAQGHAFPPTPNEGEYVIARLQQKIDPDLADTATRQRLEHDLCATYVQGLVEKHIEWITP